MLSALKNLENKWFDIEDEIKERLSDRILFLEVKFEVMSRKDATFDERVKYLMGLERTLKNLENKWLEEDDISEFEVLSKRILRVENALMHIGVESASIARGTRLEERIKNLQGLSLVHSRDVP